MDFLGIGFGEIVLILVVALMVFGPGKLPEIARTIGRFSRTLKRMSSDFTTSMSKELELEEERENLKKMSSDLKSTMTSGLSLKEEQHTHLNPDATQRQAALSAAIAPNADTSTSPQAITQAAEHD